MIDELGQKGVKSIGTIYYDPELSEAGFEGTALGNSRALEDVKRIIESLLNGTG